MKKQIKKCESQQYTRNVASFRIEVAGVKKTNEINYNKSNGKLHNRKCTRKDGGSAALALGIWLAQQQLKDLGSRQSNYSVF